MLFAPGDRVRTWKTYGVPDELVGKPGVVERTYEWFGQRRVKVRYEGFGLMEFDESELELVVEPVEADGDDELRLF